MILKKGNKYLLEIKDMNGFPPMWYALEKLQESEEVENRNKTYCSEYFASELIKAGASPNSVSNVVLQKSR